MAEKSSELTTTNPTEYDTDSENQIDYSLESGTPESSDQADNNDEVTEETEQIREQIEETRRGMSETIDAIQEKLTISNITEQVKEQVSEQFNNAVETAKGAVYEAVIGKARNFMQGMEKEMEKLDIVKSAKANPLPFVLIGLGTGLLLFNKFSRKSSSGYEYNYKGKKNNRKNNKSILKTAQNTVSETANQTYSSISNAAGTAIDSVSEAANSAYKTVGETANTAYKTVGETAGSAYEKIGDLGTQVRDTYDYYLEENPMVVGAVALAMGAAVGFTVPTTRYENQLLGETRDNLISQAETATRGVVEQVQQVAEDVGKTINEKAEDRQV